MDPLSYIVDAFVDWKLYAALLLISLTAHWMLLLRSQTLGFFDPLFFVLLGSAFGWAIVWFMYLRGDIEGRYLASFTSCELAFVTGLYMARPRRRSPAEVITPSKGDLPLAFSVLGVAGAFNIASTLLIWSIAGVPLFRVSRLGAFAGSGGLGFVERLAEGSGAIASFTALYLLIARRNTGGRWLLWVYLGWSLLAVALSGSKSALLSLGNCAFAVAFVFTNLRERRAWFWGGRAGRWFIGLATLFALFVLMVQFHSDITEAIIALAFRLVSFGDIYMFAYPDRTIEQLSGDNALVGMFGGFLSTFRLFPVDRTYTNIGYQFMLLTFPDLDYIAGPNPRHPVVAYHYFGAVGFIYSFCIGLITASAHRWLFFPRQRTYVRVLFSYLLFVALVGVSVDLEHALSRLASMILSSVVVLLVPLLVFPQLAVVKLPMLALRPLR